MDYQYSSSLLLHNSSLIVVVVHSCLSGYLFGLLLLALSASVSHGLPVHYFESIVLVFLLYVAASVLLHVLMSAYPCVE